MKNFKALLIVLLLNIVNAFGGFGGGFKSELPTDGSVGEINDDTFGKESFIADYMVVFFYDESW